MKSIRGIQRREFLKFAGASIASAFLPYAPVDTLIPIDSGRQFFLTNLPEGIRSIFAAAPRLSISADGYLQVYNVARKAWLQAPLAQTMWNMERSHRWDRLNPERDWSIVLHWFGDKGDHDLALDGYMRGFDSLRPVADYVTRTSAHFLVGNGRADTTGRADELKILQTQQPDTDGMPFLGSHLTPLDYVGHREHKQYFVRALYSLAADEPGIHSSLQDYFDGPKIDPNRATIAVEISGYDFDSLEHAPSTQKVANVVALVWALMKRYRVPAMNILGHHEIQLSKADPGKKFMALVRFLVGVKALLERDSGMLLLVFGNFYLGESGWERAARKYFQFVRNQLVMVTTPIKVYEWERTSGYWLVMDLLGSSGRRKIDAVSSPLHGQPKLYGKHYLQPETHEGLDFYAEKLLQKTITSSIPVKLFASGECIFAGRTGRCHEGIVAIFRHLQADGAEVLSVYGNLSTAPHLSRGNHYLAGDLVGTLDSGRLNADPFLHFALAYGASWDNDPHSVAAIPLNAQSSWIRARFLEPGAYLQSYGVVQGEYRNLKE